MSEPPEDIWETLGLHPAGEPGWVITWSLSPPDWATVRHPGMPAGLRVRVGDDVYEASVAGQLAVLSTL